ncbi:hypothetical protein PILCRDRAFT_814506 [Piloderma croceum F 1598]|uniref:Transcription initiation factor TFIID subunit 11 n=1 Tax=Piloderma croceum (strain F 1598) TaxID=765440 RepID=A0A0C3CDK2_PILCF|nr:hypothetical protein PILCRDRAFT_814506 [Piloderma croceum F 1598]
MNPNSPFNHYTAPAFIQATPGSTTPRGRGRGSSTGPKRGRKPRGSLPNINVNPRPLPQAGPSTSQPTTVQWAQPITQMPASSTSEPQRTPSVGITSAEQSQGTSANATQSQGTVLSLPGTMPILPVGAGGTSQRPSGAAGVDEDGDGEDELLPAMADDDFAAQSSWNSQSKDNLKVLMDNFSPEQYDRFEAYRRHALPKQAVRKVIQQSLGQQVSQPVAQIVAGFAKVFVGEIVEKARSVQERRGDTGPLSPDHLREAYRMYQEETGRVGAARPLRSKRLFVR